MIFIGEKIKSLRKEKRITQKELAERLGVSTSTIAMYETDKIKPSIEILVEMAKYFEITTDELLGLSEI